ncbi:TetR/AcrR family transcriptional regulator [Mycolicibacterium sediminis]|uniref:TetR family transcriptional regulator n=1 Tax=Mycolicibacterium sediminis TaxID=1286180 RepID=A0A7I7QL13_9MYCO|nr:TetR/AcrR family transcriptional regulator [Mycolicibacterium sediminis]BBY26955.1 TetR family transcriptional regulator [Mycolicibacterium sediminis]
MTKSWPSRRTAPAVRKGDLRERQILDAAETLLVTRGYADMTVSDIAAAAGLTRGALYFYFASKQDVLIALVARTVQALQEKSAAASTATGPVEEVVSTTLERTAALWREHGPVMRAAVDLSSTVPDIDELWTGTADVFAEAIAAVLQRAGTPPGDGPGDAAALGHALCWMIERTFYQATRTSDDGLDDATQTCRTVWLHVMNTGSAG